MGGRFWKSSDPFCIYVHCLQKELRTLVVASDVGYIKPSDTEYFIWSYTAWKVSKNRVISGTYFLYSDWIQENTVQKKLRLWTHFKQCLPCEIYVIYHQKWVLRAYITAWKVSVIVVFLVPILNTILWYVFCYT